MNPALDVDELVVNAKLLGVILDAEMHVNCILSLYSQSVYFLKRLRDQGLDQRHLDLVFKAILVC